VAPVNPRAGRIVRRRKCGRRRAVVDLVRWSFMMALTPLALGLVWELISWIGNRIVLAPARPSVKDEPRRRPHTINCQCTSGYISASGWSPCM
jgi:hypothetical protein